VSTSPTNLSTTLEAFLDSQDFKASVFSSTRGKRQQTRYLVELAPDGVYRVLEEGQIGNIAEVPSHVFLEIPTLEDKELVRWNGTEETYFNHIFTAKQADLANQLRNQLRQTFL